MKRYCLTLDLKDDSDLIREYEFWHRSENIWPEIPAGIREVGIESMEIYRFSTYLFMILEVGSGFDFESDMARLTTLPRQKEWEVFVSKFQNSAPGETSLAKWKRMERIFELGT